MIAFEKMHNHKREELLGRKNDDILFMEDYTEKIITFAFNTHTISSQTRPFPQGIRSEGVYRGFSSDFSSLTL